MPYPKTVEHLQRAACACVIALALAPGAAYAQSQAQPTEQTAPPAAAAATGWQTNTSPAAPAEPQAEPAEQQPLDAQPPISLSNEQITLLARINEYLNSLKNVEGRFVQTDHRNEETKGRFYVKRPGKLRFDYASPSMLRIVSDGEYLSIEDHDLKTVDKFPLDATPIQLLLGKDVNLTRDAVILDMRQDDTAVVVTLRDKSGTAAGQLQLFFKLPELELYEWVITDAQGLDTRVELADLQNSEEKSEGFFEASSIMLDKLNSR